MNTEHPHIACQKCQDNLTINTVIGAIALLWLIVALVVGKPQEAIALAIVILACVLNEPRVGR